MRHDRNVFPLEGAPKKRRRWEGAEEAENKEEPGETLRQSCVQEERRVQAKAED